MCRLNDLKDAHKIVSDLLWSGISNNTFFRWNESDIMVSAESIMVAVRSRLSEQLHIERQSYPYEN
jgi:hypothetical protein